MRRTATLLLLLAGALEGAVVIDRIAVAVNKHAIKLSDLERDARLTEFMNREPLDLGEAELRKSADRLIDQALIRDEIARGGYRRPGESDAEGLLKRMVHDRFAGSDARLREALTRYGLSEGELRAYLEWQLTVLAFIDQRFRPAVQVTDEETQQYYNQHLAELKREFPRDNSFATLEAKIRARLEGDQVNQNFSAWLAETRKSARIVYEEGAFGDQTRQNHP